MVQIISNPNLFMTKRAFLAIRAQELSAISKLDTEKNKQKIKQHLKEIDAIDEMLAACDFQIQKNNMEVTETSKQINS